MRGIELSLMIVIAAGVVGGVWFALRGRRYGAAAACVIASLAITSLQPVIAPYVRSGWELLSNAPASHCIMTSLLASAASTMALAAFWTGYGRGYWFWRALAPSAFLAALAVIEANEPILLALIAMPLIAVGGWGLRWRQDRQPDAEGAASFGRWRWALRDALLAFVIVGLWAFVARSLSLSEMYLVPVDLAITSAVIVSVTLAAFVGGLSKSLPMRLVVALCLVGIVFGSGVMLAQRDALGLAPFYDVPTAPLSRIAQLYAALGSVSLALAAVSFLHRVAISNMRPVWKRIARGAQWLLIAAVVAPCMLAYLRLIPSPAIAPLPPSATYAKIQAAGQKATALRTPGFQTAPIVKEAAAALAEPGNVWFDARRFRETELSGDFDMSFHRESMLSSLLDVETAAAEKAGRSSAVLELSLLQWRLGRVLRRGGIAMDWNIGWRAEKCGCAAITGILGKLTDDECRQVLAEVRASLVDRPDFQTVMAYDAYWNRTWYGWRNELYRASRQLLGEPPRRAPITDEFLGVIDSLGLLRWRLLETRLALELYHRELGIWPESLDELTPAYLNSVPIDPFSNKPLIYGRRGQSFVLYSVGKDGQDSGGLFPPDGDPALRFQNGDIDWDCERRELTNTWPRKKP